jgi:hypothetical protein
VLNTAGTDFDTKPVTGIFWQNRGGSLLTPITGSNIVVTVKAGDYAMRTSKSDNQADPENRKGTGGDVRLKPSL